MNYLAHLHIASHTQTSFLGNFLGDFVKGNPSGQYNEQVVQGIRLHRFVDSYTDSHALIRSVKPLFPTALRRFSPIALDMFWDHCLAKYWSRFYGQSLHDFCLQAESVISKERQVLTQDLPNDFINVSQQVWKGQWFKHYASLENIDFALQRIALRRARMAPLVHAFATLAREETRLSDVFFEFYPQVLQASLAKSKKETL